MPAQPVGWAAQIKGGWLSPPIQATGAPVWLLVSTTQACPAAGFTPGRLAQQGQFQADGVVGLALCLALVAILGHQVGRHGRQGVLAEEGLDLADAGVLPGLGAGLLQRHDLALVAVERIGDGRALVGGAADVDAANHLILGASRPVFRVTFGAEGFAGGRPALAADQCLPGARGGLHKRRHVRSMRAQCTDGVPKGGVEKKACSVSTASLCYPI